MKLYSAFDLHSNHRGSEAFYYESFLPAIKRLAISGKDNLYT